MVRVRFRGGDGALVDVGIWDGSRVDEPESSGIAIASVSVSISVFVLGMGVGWRRWLD